MSYVALLYQDLIKQGQLTRHRRLPPVFPIVLYNGNRRWNAAQNVRDLVEPIPGGLEKYCPSMHYLLLDEGAIVNEQPAIADELKNLASALFRLEHSRNENDLIDIIAKLAQWLNTPEQSSIRRAFTAWVVQVLFPKQYPGAKIPETQDLHEVQNMLAERVKEWAHRWEEEGRLKGKLEGQLEGKLESQKEFARNLIQQTDMDNATIASLTGLEEQEIQRMRTLH